MAIEVSVPVGATVDTSSSAESSAHQRYRVFRRFGDAEYKEIIIVPGGGGSHFEPWDRDCVYRIDCESSWPEQGIYDWRANRERVAAGTPPGVTVIQCEDAFSTDNDWNDLIVNVAVKKTKIRRFGIDDETKP